MTFEEILANGEPMQIIAALKEKTISIPAWSGKDGLQDAYDPTRHPVMDKAIYPDIVDDKHRFIPVTRVTYDLQRLAVKRMTELITGIPVRRIYKPENDRQKTIATVMDKILQRNRIDSVNIERCNMLFAGCEVMTLWYAVEEKNRLYGIDSPLKIRCRNFTPMHGDSLYPLFDEYGDMISLSVQYTRKVGGNTVTFFDAYTKDRHMKFSSEDGWRMIEDEKILLGKIPGIYMFRPTPIWEDTSKIVYEMEWAMSRNGNYLRDNSKPLFVVFADEVINYGDEGDPNEEFKSVMQYPKQASAQYITWEQAIDNLKFFINELRQSFFTQLQLPDWSYEKMSQQALSGESRKQLFIDAQLKVKDESGRLLEFFDREINVLRAFLKAILPAAFHTDIESLPVETEITPFSINDDKDTISNLMSANGGQPIMSQRESIEMLGWSDDVDRTLQEIQAQSEQDVFNPPTDF